MDLPNPNTPTYYIHIYINHSRVEELNQEKLFNAIYAVELLLILVTVFVIPVAARMAFRIKFFHENLSYIFSIALYQYYLSICARVYLIGVQSYYIGPKHFNLLHNELSIAIASLIRIYYMGFVIGCLYVVAAERLAALWYVSSYEREHRYYVAAIPIVLNSIIAFTMSFCVCAEYMTFLVGIFLALFLNTSAIVLFFFVMWRNEVTKRRISSLHANLYSLSGQYQINENQLVVKMLISLAVACSIFNMIIALSFLFAEYYDRTSLVACILYELSDFIIAIYGVFIPGMGAVLCPPIRKRCVDYCKKRLSKGPVSDTREMTDQNGSLAYITNRRGRTMYVGANQEDYFRQLRTQW